MDSRDAARLIAPAVHIGEQWADLGAGEGTFTVALAHLIGATGAVYAVERDQSALRSLDVVARARTPQSAPIAIVRGDFTQPFELPVLDGALFANALHFVSTDQQANVLRQVADRLVNDGALIVVEYDDRQPSRWVPFPVSFAQLNDLARRATLGAPQQIGRRRSIFGGNMYAARVPRH
jgi:SAM-dependent methyltransferase